MILADALPMFDFSWLNQPDAWIALLTLSVLEIVLGIDNIVFISILVDKLPKDQQPRARFLGLALAMVMRILLLFSITWVMSLKNDLFSVFGHGFSGKDLILIVGGLFLLAKSTHEIHDKIEGDPEGDVERKARRRSIVWHDPLPDRHARHRVLARLGHHRGGHGPVHHDHGHRGGAGRGVHDDLRGRVSDFINEHPTVKMLALSFLILIGVMLIIEGFAPAKAHELHLKNYIYFAMGFSVFVEMLNIRVSKKRKAKLAAEKGAL